MAKYIKITDGGRVGYHSVPDDFRLPRAEDHESYEFVQENEARAAHPDLFGPAAESPKPTK